MRDVRSRNSTLLVLSLGLTLSVAVNFLQGTRLIALQKAADGGGSQITLSAGTRVPDMHVQTLKDRDAILPFEKATQRPTVAYVFSPSCVWCRRNAASLASLAAQTKAQYDFVAVSLSSIGVQEFLASNPLSFPVYQHASPETIRALKLGHTPETIVIAPDGRVLASWSGAYQGAIKSGVEQFFRVKLPELANSSN